MASRAHRRQRLTAAYERNLSVADYARRSLGLGTVRIVQLGLTVLGSIGALFVRPRIEMADDSVDVGLAPAELLALMRERFAGSPDDILAIEPHRLVRRFSGSEGRFTYKTIEVVRYEDDAITFEHIAGPFAECNERFQLTPIRGGTRLTHTGYFRLRGGLWTLLLAAGPVKKAFESHVHGHFETMASTHPLLVSVSTGTN